MDEYLNNRQKEVLLRLLANPADTGGAYLSNLQELVKTYPQSGLFRALYGRALNESSPLVAGAYFDSRALHKLLHHHDNIAPIANTEVVMQPNGKLFGDAPTQLIAQSNTLVAEEEPTMVQVEDDTIFTDQPLDFPDVLGKTWPNNPQETVPEQIIETETPLDEPVAEILPEDITHQQQPVAVETNQTETAEPAAETPPFAPAPWEMAEPAAAPAPVIDEEPLGRAPWELDDDEEDEIPAPATKVAPIAIEAPLTEIEEDEDTGPILDNNLAAKLAYWSSIDDEYDAPGAQIPPVAAEQPAYTETVDTANAAPTHHPQETPINEEVYNEITGIDEINMAQLNAEPPLAETLTAPVAETEQPAPHDEADRLILGNIAATDYFVFDKAFGDNKIAEPAPTPEPAPKPMFREHTQPTTPTVQPQHNPAPAPAHHDVSKYHDEKMPYTFMWWLDKTRKEHGTLYQPYAKAPVNRSQAQPPAQNPKQDELQQQYFENIFHLSSAEELVPDAAQTIEFDMQSKEDRLIQRFITEDPHIHPPVGEKLDTENKAKKSSEDAYEMVTETLARIYADQMLFPKAIATYKKLMLKFPEKSRYFASRIENLEKRTN